MKNYFLIEFNKSTSKNFSKVVKSFEKIAKKVKSKNQKEYCFSMSLNDYINNFKIIRNIMGKCYSWNHINIFIGSKNVSPYSFESFTQSYIGCMNDCYKQKHKNKYCTENNSLDNNGCRKLPTIFLGMPDSVREFNYTNDYSYWWFKSISEIKKENAIINKQNLKDIIKGSLEEYPCEVCPFFSDSNIDIQLSQIPNKLKINRPGGISFIKERKLLSKNEIKLDSIFEYLVIPFDLVEKYLDNEMKMDRKFEKDYLNYKKEEARKEEKYGIRAHEIKPLQKETISKERRIVLDSHFDYLEYSDIYEYLINQKLVDEIDLLVIKNKKYFSNFLKLIEDNYKNIDDLYIKSSAIEFLQKYYSFENYKYNKIRKYIENLLKEIDFDPTLPYLTVISIDNYTLPREVKKHIKQNHDIVKYILNDFSEYIILNEDKSKLHSFIKKYGSCYSVDRLAQFYQILTALDSNTIIPINDFAKILIGDYYTPPTKNISWVTYFKIDPIVDSYFVKKFKSKNYLQKQIIEEFSFFLKKYKSNVRSFRKVKPEEDSHNILAYHLIDNSLGSKVFKSSKFKRGIPSISVEDSFFDLTREFQNSIRKKMGLPNIGEGWVSEAKLLENVKKWFPKNKIKHQWSPDWLGRQRIDIGIIDLKIAIEYHGTQHYKPVDFFGGEEAFRRQQERDKKKKELCKKNGVILLEFNETHSETEIRNVITKKVKECKK